MGGPVYRGGSLYHAGGLLFLRGEWRSGARGTLGRWLSGEGAVYSPKRRRRAVPWRNRGRTPWWPTESFTCGTTAPCGATRCGRTLEVWECESGARSGNHAEFEGAVTNDPTRVPPGWEAVAALPAPEMLREGQLAINCRGQQDNRAVTVSKQADAVALRPGPAVRHRSRAGLARDGTRRARRRLRRPRWSPIPVFPADDFAPVRRRARAGGVQTAWTSGVAEDSAGLGIQERRSEPPPTGGP